MIIFRAVFVSTIAILLLSVMFISSQRVQFADAGTVCIDYRQAERAITISCDASFGDVVNTMNNQGVLENLGNQEYLLNANLQVGDGATLSMNSNDVKWLKLADGNGIIVDGKIRIDGLKITSWDASTNDVIGQNMNGTISRGYIQFAASEGADITNSEIAYLGYIEPGKRGFDLFGGGGPSHDMTIRGSKFHDMWMAFYSNGAYNIKVDGNEYYNNIKYALDPHTGTHDMNVTNNWVHHNIQGVICSDDCYNILIEGNTVHHNSNAGIFFSRNMTDSIARNNHVYDTSTGILISESPNNQIYNNIVEGATDEAVLVFNPDIPDDGQTANNHIYNNMISNSDDGIRASSSHDNILENNTFYNITSSEYNLSGNSSMTIRGQHFDNALISIEGSAPNNIVEIVDSGTIHVVEANEGEAQEDNNNNNNGDNDEDEGDSFNTDDTPFRMTLGEDEGIRVNSDEEA